MYKLKYSVERGANAVGEENSKENRENSGVPIVWAGEILY